MKRALCLALSALALAACAPKAPPAPPPAEAGPAPAPDAPAPAPAREPSRWAGAVDVGSMSLRVIIALEPGDGDAWTGAIDIPDQGAKGLALQDVSVGDGELEFTLAPPGAPEARWALFALERRGDRAEGFMEQSGRSFPVKLRRLAPGEDPGPRRPQTPQPPFPYEAREVTIDRGAVRLACTLVLPPAGGPHPTPALALLTGSGAQDRDETIFEHRPFAVLADDLGRHGVATLRCDDRGVGGSTGSTLETTQAELVLDALAMLDRLAEEPALQGGRRGLLGHSEGAQIAIEAAAKRPKDVRMLVLLAGMGVPARPLLAAQLRALSRAAGVADAAVDELVRRQQALLDAIVAGRPDAEIDATIEALVLAESPEAAKDPQSLAATVAGQRAMVTSRWFKSLLAADPGPHLRKIKAAPVLAIGGALDLQVPAEDNLAAIAAALQKAGNKDVTVALLPGLNHLLQPATTGVVAEYAEIELTLDPQVLERVRAWILARP